MNYRQQLLVIEGLFIPPDTSIRMDCPFCHGKNTLSVDTATNNINWFCFHASCKAKGKYQGEKDMTYVNSTFNQKEEMKNLKFEMPDSFVSVYSDDKAMKYLHKNNCWEAWSWGRATIKFDIAQNRVVFCAKDPETDEIVGAVGRGLNSKVYPKWYMYGNKDIPFTCGLREHKEAILVEDCASACAVSNVLTGIALMGTSLKESHKKHLTQYDKLYIGLDRDATVKSFGIANELKSYGIKNVHVKTLEDDLKYFGTKEIEEMFND
jgi:hypothetical protein